MSIAKVKSEALAEFELLRVNRGLLKENWLLTCRLKTDQMTPE
jgi:hypothetical protein